MDIANLRELLDLITETIDLRSFSNLWYWIVLAVLWSTASHYVLGVPYDMVARARRGHEPSAYDMRMLAEINTSRLLAIMEMSGPIVTGFAFFVLSMLAFLGWAYRVEFAQAVFLLAFPMSLLFAYSLHTAARLRRDGFSNLASVLRRHRKGIQVLGVVSIFVTALWGMYTNMTVTVLGG